MKIPSTREARGTVKIFIYSTALLKFYISTIALTRPDSVLTNVYRAKLFPLFHHWIFLIFKVYFIYIYD